MGNVAYYKVCPECRAEHTRTTERCADCGVPLVHPDALPTEAAPVELPPASALSCVRVAPLPWIRALSEALEQAGVSHRVEQATAADAPPEQNTEVFDGAALFGLYVEESAGAAARELDRAIAVQVLPEEAPPLAEGEQDACPACGAALAATATECPECELVFA
jgi:hypothetical protein